MDVTFPGLPILILLFLIVPWVIGFAWVMPDANRHEQPGLLWEVLTFPLSWLVILIYLVVRALWQPGMRI